MWGWSVAVRVSAQVPILCDDLHARTFPYRQLLTFRHAAPVPGAECSPYGRDGLAFAFDLPTRGRAMILARSFWAKTRRASGRKLKRLHRFDLCLRSRAKRPRVGAFDFAAVRLTVPTNERYRPMNGTCSQNDDMVSIGHRIDARGGGAYSCAQCLRVGFGCFFFAAAALPHGLPQTKRRRLTGRESNKRGTEKKQPRESANSPGPWPVS